MKTYQSILIHPQLPKGRCEGLLTISENKAIFFSQEITCEFNLLNISLSAGGSGGGFVFLNDSTNTKITVFTSDKSILKNESLIAIPHLINSVNISKKTLKKPIIIGGSILFLFVVFIAGIYFSKDKMVEKLANQVPQEW